MKTIFQDLEELKEKVDSKEAQKIIKELEKKFRLLRTKSGLSQLLKKRKLSKIVKNVKYEEELKELQVELIKLQNWVYEHKKRVMIIFEGRDAAGKGGAIKRFIQYLNPRKFRVAALPKPTEVEIGQFYFQRYFKHLPDPGEIVFFDRSWYNRAIVEPVYGFCTKERMTNPLKRWKLSPVDQKAQEMWDKITAYKEEMFSRTHTSYAPWIIVDSNDKKRARLESIRYVLSQIPYEGKEDAKINLHHDPDVVERYHRITHQSDKS